MEYVQLGQTDLQVSRIGFGCHTISGRDWGKVDDRDSIAAVRRALDLGINLFDTADVYGLGHSEEILSKALGYRRHEVVIATKFGINWEPDPKGGRARTFYDNSPKRVVEALEASLRRLNLDCIPLYQIHWPDPETPIVDTMEALKRCQEAGKVRYIGCCNFSQQLVCEASKHGRLESLQAPYNLAERDIEKGILGCCKELGVSTLVYSPLAQGLFTGKYGSDVRFPRDDLRSRSKYFQGQEFRRNLTIVQRLGEVGDRYGKSPGQVAIRWILDNPLIACAITGIRTPRHIEENTGALGWNLSREEWEFLAG